MSLTLSGEFFFCLLLMLTGLAVERVPNLTALLFISSLRCGSVLVLRWLTLES